MAFWLKKAVSFWLMPLPLSLALLLGGALIWRFTAKVRLGRLLVITGGLWLLMCSNVGVGNGLIHDLENQFPAQPAFAADAPLPAALARCQFIIVLGGGHTPVAAWSANNQLSDSALSRIVEGVRLARLLSDARLIVSGPRDPDGDGPSHARLYADVAVSLGVVRERIIEVTDARDTEEEVRVIQTLTQAAPCALVTSAWHLPRAMALCRARHLDALACPADYAGRPPELRLKDFLNWNLGGLERSTKAVYEFFGSTWARLRGEV